MPYQLNLRDDGILHVRFDGNLDMEEWQAYTQEFQPFLELASERQPLHFLVDANQVGKLSAAGRKAVVESMRNPDPRIGKTAMIGATRYIRVLAGFILRAVGREDVRFFRTEQEALDWLKQ